MYILEISYFGIFSIAGATSPVFSEPAFCICSVYIYIYRYNLHLEYKL